MALRCPCPWHLEHLMPEDRYAGQAWPLMLMSRRVGSLSMVIPSYVTPAIDVDVGARLHLLRGDGRNPPIWREGGDDSRVRHKEGEELVAVHLGDLDDSGSSSEHPVQCPKVVEGLQFGAVFDVHTVFLGGGRLPRPGFRDVCSGDPDLLGPRHRTRRWLRSANGPRASGIGGWCSRRRRICRATAPLPTLDEGKSFLSSRIHLFCDVSPVSPDLSSGVRSWNSRKRERGRPARQNLHPGRRRADLHSFDFFSKLLEFRSANLDLRIILHMVVLTCGVLRVQAVTNFKPPWPGTTCVDICDVLTVQVVTNFKPSWPGTTCVDMWHTYSTSSHKLQTTMAWYYMCRHVAFLQYKQSQTSNHHGLTCGVLTVQVVKNFKPPWPGTTCVDMWRTYSTSSHKLQTTMAWYYMCRHVVYLQYKQSQTPIHHGL
ncbi:hypothetical protein LAZ67_6002203, partial [Cordylochernes scorpioides]